MRRERNRVISIIKKISRQRGAERESAVNKALAGIRDNSEIVSFYKTGRRVDKFQGIDFYIIKMNGEKVLLQVKSSRISMLNHLKKFPSIPVIIVKMEDDIESIKNKIRELLI